MSHIQPPLHSIDSRSEVRINAYGSPSNKPDMLSDIAELRTFVQIIKAGSLTAASRDMGLALSVISKRLAKLERRTETQLIARNTRSMALTTEGQQLFYRSQRILAEIEEAETALTRGKLEPKGLLRISAPLDIGRTHVAPVCCELTRSHPDISISLILTDGIVDLINDHVDIAIRVGTPQDSELVMRKLADDQQIVAASPEYLERYGIPSEPEDLTKHDCLLCYDTKAIWQLTNESAKLREIEVSSRLHCDNGEVARDWAIAGCGILMQSWIDLMPHLSTRRLMQILPNWHSEPSPVYALFVDGKRMPTRTRLFLEASAQHFARITSNHAKTPSAALSHESQAA